ERITGPDGRELFGRGGERFLKDLFEIAALAKAIDQVDEPPVCHQELREAKGADVGQLRGKLGLEKVVGGGERADRAAQLFIPLADAAVISRSQARGDDATAAFGQPGRYAFA